MCLQTVIISCLAAAALMSFKLFLITFGGGERVQAERSGQLAIANSCTKELSERARGRELEERARRRR